MLIQAIRMASEGVLQRLKQRADMADQIALQLRTRIDALKTAAAQSGSSVEEEKLRKENEKLKTEINNIKLEITLAEINNGVKQVFLPFQKSAAVVSSTPSDSGNNKRVADSSAPVKQDKKEKTVIAKGPTGDGEKKPSKDNKPKKEGKAKPPPAASEEKVDISRLDMRIGKIVDVKKHPDADSLYIEDVDVGEGKTRTVISGLVKHIPIEEMQNRLAVFMCNLKPQKMRGILSEGMIMCASCPEKVELLVPPPGVVVGDRVKVKDFPGEPDAQLNPKKKIWETLKPDVRTNQQKVATYKGSPFTVEGKGEVVAPTLANTQIS